LPLIRINFATLLCDTEDPLITTSWLQTLVSRCYIGPSGQCMRGRPMPNLLLSLGCKTENNPTGPTRVKSVNPVPYLGGSPR
jgi:hypothetical protein